nr:hypothetical protein [Bacillus thuringiensis serovar israelensis]
MLAMCYNKKCKRVRIQKKPICIEIGSLLDDDENKIFFKSLLGVSFKETSILVLVLHNWNL